MSSFINSALKKFSSGRHNDKRGAGDCNALIYQMGEGLATCPSGLIDGIFEAEAAAGDRILTVRSRITGLSTFTRRTSISVNWQVSDPASPKFWDCCRCWTPPVPNSGTAAADPARIWDCGRR